uniref:FLYWCH-type domain-containing protein n=1 Tax=Meloidogyne incognita TaxID=6306 RepID=A0A914M3N5_MELIC
MNIQSTSNPEIVEVKVFSNGNVKEEVNEEDGQFSQLVDQILEKNTFVEFNFTISSKGRELLRRDGFEFRFEGDSKIEGGTEIWRCVHQQPYCKGRIHVKKDLLVHDGQKFKLGVVVNGEHNHPAKHEAVRDVLNILKEQACMENPLPVREAVKLARESVPIDLRKAGECSTATMGRCYRNYLKVSFSVFDGFFWVERFGRFFETFLFYLS